MIDAPPSDKTALRALMRRTRALCASERPDAAEAAAEALPLERLPPVALAAGYWAQGSEMSSLPLLRRLADLGLQTALPVAEDRDSALSFRLWREGDALAPDAFGIPSPLETAPEAHPDLVIAPLLAFDGFGARLGQGAGHYDRTLQALRARGPVFVLGLAYAGQELDRAPQDDHDERLDGVLTEDGYRTVRL